MPKGPRSEPKPTETRPRMERSSQVGSPVGILIDMERLLLWSGLDAERWEVAHLDLSADGVSGSGTQVGFDPIPYRLDYHLEAPDHFVTSLLDVRVRGEDWSRRLILRHDGDGAWSWDVEVHGADALDPPGGGPELRDELVEARDCDLGLSPLTNTMPIRRHGMRRAGDSFDMLAAWVSVPDLKLYAYRQQYDFVRSDGRGSVVRFIDRGLSPGFRADLVLDADGFIDEYPELARRIVG